MGFLEKKNRADEQSAKRFSKKHSISQGQVTPQSLPEPYWLQQRSVPLRIYRSHQSKISSLVTGASFFLCLNSRWPMTNEDWSTILWAYNNFQDLINPNSAVLQTNRDKGTERERGRSKGRLCRKRDLQSCWCIPPHCWCFSWDNVGLCGSEAWTEVMYNVIPWLKWEILLKRKNNRLEHWHDSHDLYNKYDQLSHFTYQCRWQASHLLGVLMIMSPTPGRA